MRGLRHCREAYNHICRKSDAVPSKEVKDDTWTMAPVSSVAGFVAPCAVLPLTAGSDWETFRSMFRGGSTEMTSPLKNRRSQLVPSSRY